MKFSCRFENFLFLQVIFLIPPSLAVHSPFPIVLLTWNYTGAAEKAWQTLHDEGRSALDAIEYSCNVCENDIRYCYGSVGFGDIVDESGKSTIDALIMDGETMNVGAVGVLRNVKNAISVARRVLENTEHTLLAGELAEEFAVQMGFQKESYNLTRKAENVWQKWKNENCQPNFWKNVVPDPSKSCGPYKPIKDSSQLIQTKVNAPVVDESNHDTMGVITIDSKGHIAAGVSTNGWDFKIPGRMGDSPTVGAGAYAVSGVGAAAATGDGDIMMRYLPSFYVVEQMRHGVMPTTAIEFALDRIVEKYPKFSGAIIALNKTGGYGAACYGFPFNFTYYVANLEFGKPKLFTMRCRKAH